MSQDEIGIGQREAHARFQSIVAKLADPQIVERLAIPDPVQRVGKLRKLGLSIELTQDLLEVWDTRKRAIEKLPAAENLWMTGRSFEQASSQRIAAWKAKRLAGLAQNQAGVGSPADQYVVLDLCCGMGADAMSLVGEFPTVLVDRDPLLVEFANSNVKNVASAFPSHPLCCDVNAVLEQLERRSESPLTLGDLAKDWNKDLWEWCLANGLQKHKLLWHLDPDRRSQSGRHIRIEDFSPSRSFIERLLHVCPQGLLKVAPATSIPSDWESDHDWIWLGEDGECKQLVGQFGFGGGTRHTAVWNRHSVAWETFSAKTGHELPLSAAPLCDRGELIEFHSALRLAGLQDELARQLGALPVQHDYYYQTGKTGTSPKAALYSVFHIVELLPPRARKIEVALQQRGLRVTEVKKLKTPADFQQRLIGELKKSFSGAGEPASVLLVQLPQKGKVQAVLAIRQR